MLSITKNRLKAQSVITTVAGNGTQGFSGDNITATTCELYDPIAVSFDFVGNLYIADAGNNRIRKINTTGIISTIAGNGTAGYSGDNAAATAAELYNPYYVTIDDTGNLYISDYLNNRIRKVNTLGIITTIAGTGIAGYSGDNGLAINAQLNAPTGLLFYQSALYIADIFNNRIRMVNTSGIITTIAGTGTAGYSGDNGETTSAQLNGPADIVFDKVGNLYLTDFENNRVRKINTAGTITTIAGTGIAGYNGDNIQATTAELNHPFGIICDWSGNIFFSEQSNNRIRKIDTNNIITTIAGIGTGGYNEDNITATTAELNYPEGITLDTLGNLYIADNDNNRIRKVTNVGQAAGIKEVAAYNGQLIVYPNPTKGILNIECLLLNESTEVKITNTLGEEVRSRNLEGRSNLQVDVSNLQNGVYFVQVTTSTNFCTQKFIVQH